MTVITTEAFVIGSINLKESDRIMSFYTKEEGKISAVGKGARKSRKRFACSMELLDHLNISYFKKEGKEIYSLSSVDLIHSISHSQIDLKKIALFSYIVELIREFSPPGEANNDIFDLLIWFHRITLVESEYMLIICIFILKLLLYSGFAPQMNQCCSCSSKVDGKEYFFSNEKNGILCSKCVEDKCHDKPINLGLIKFIERINSSGTNMLERIKLSNREAAYLFKILDPYTRLILEKKLKSIDFLKEVFREG